MKKKKTILTIIAALFLMIFVSCSDINPFFAGGVVPGGNWIYFAVGSDINKMRLDGSEVEKVFTISDSGTWSPRLIQLDSFTQKIYISLDNILTSTSSKLMEYNLDGSGEKVLVDTGDIIGDLAIDHLNGYLYTVSASGIKRIDLKTSQVEDFYAIAMTLPVYLAPDYKGSVYYLDDNDNLSRADKNYSSVFLATLSPAGFRDLSYDRNNNLLYSHNGPSLYKINPINGSYTFLVDPTPVVINSKIPVYILENKIYFYDTAAFDFFSINIDGSGLKPVKLDITGVSAFDILSK